MSRLRELRLHGFKSFADPTRFVFERGVNAVIGPNGSGKSNMADAVRWVLGEQSNRSLRTRRSDDVIFGGSDARRPQGMAEAILTLDNGDGWLPIDFAEVSIGRRAYRSGESEYLINGARARLKDVVELLGEGRLGANELVVVGQGTVDAALSLRPEERRQLFEEAAGVKGLQVRRNEASARLGRARDNLTRVNDLISELKPQVRRLALQAEHQQQHDALGHRARALVHASHRRREQAARAALGEARRAAAAAEAALDAHRDEQEAGRAAQADAERRYWAAEEAARQLAGRRQEAREELIRLEGRDDAIAARERELAAAVERGTAELADLEARITGGSSGDAAVDVDPAILAAEQAEARWRSAVAALAAADEALLAAEQAAADLRARHSDRIASTARVEEALERHGIRLRHAEAEVSEARSDLAGYERQLADARADAERADAAASAALERLDAQAGLRDAAQEAADATRGRAVEASERLRAARAELAALAEPHDAGSRLGRRLADAGWRTLLDALEAPEAAWPAIEAVVGAELDATLLWDAGGDPLAPLRDARGTARLLAGGPVDGAERGQALSAVGGTQTVAEWIGLDAPPVALSHAALAPTVEALVDGWQSLPAGWVAVTAEGDVADRRGISLRGRGEPTGAASVRTHLRRRELGSAIGEMEAATRATESEAHAATEALRASRADHLAAREAHDAAERAARVARESVEAADAARRRASERLARAEAELAALRSDAPPAPEGVDAGGPSDGLDEVQAAAERARADRDRAARDRDEARDAWTATRHKADEIQHRAAGARQARLEAEGRLVQLRRSLPEQREALDRIVTDRSQLEPSLAAARATVVEIEGAVADAERTRNERRLALQELETRVGGTSRLGELERAAQSAAIEASRRDEGLAALLREREMALETLPELETGAEPDRGLDEEIAALDDAALDAELRRVRRTLAQIGSVNPFAVEEHAELSGRLEEMSGQDADLRSAIGSTEELIATLDVEITAQFDRAFRAIGEKFDEYCQLLFAGGSAALQLADEADGDAPGGIEIVVRPPGKRLQRLAMLSGGERALTGVALLFAMLTVNPVPFCILDEVDAALDEANIGRFADALRRLSDSIDFVVITHNRATIEVADTIYGVTMTDAAVSRVLSLRLADVPVEVSA